MKSLVKFYIANFLRRIHYFILIFLAVSAAGIYYSQVLPSVYISRAILLVEASQIPGALAQTTVNTSAEEQLQIIQQRLLTRTNLLEVARKLNVFEDMETMSADDIVADMRLQTSITRTSGRNQATFMYISFESENPQTAANVANEFVTLVLEDNTVVRTARAAETLQFFEREVERLNFLLQEQSNKIIDFKNKNSDALPETMNFRQTQQSQLQSQLNSIQGQIDALNDQKIRLTQIFQATGSLGSAANTNLTPEQQQLANLQQQLNSLLAVLSPENPRIKVLQAQITQLETTISAQAPVQQGQATPPRTMLDFQIADIDTRIDQFQRQLTTVQAEIDKIAESVARTPTVAIHLNAMLRDSANIQTQYTSAVNRLATAATGERIETQSKGQTIAILESAAVPTEAAKPARLKIALAGILGGIGLGVGLVVLLEILNKSIQRPADITRGLGITPITTIPYIRTPMELVMRRALLVGLFAIIAIGVPALLYAVHVYYLPLDLIYERVAGKFSDYL